MELIATSIAETPEADTLVTFLLQRAPYSPLAVPEMREQAAAMQKIDPKLVERIADKFSRYRSGAEFDTLRLKS
jgi:hypothetical protein